MRNYLLYYFFLFPKQTATAKQKNKNKIFSRTNNWVLVKTSNLNLSKIFMSKSKYEPVLGQSTESRVPNWLILGRSNFDTAIILSHKYREGDTARCKVGRFG